jgi:hypothetical protein
MGDVGASRGEVMNGVLEAVMQVLNEWFFHLWVANCELRVGCRYL